MESDPHAAGASPRKLLRTLVEAVACERRANDGKAEVVRRAFVSLSFGLVLIAFEAAILAGRSVFR